MKKNQYILVSLCFLLSFPVYAEQSMLQWLFDFTRNKGVNPATNETYLEECEACHFPFQPGLLPEQSWEKLLSAKQLANHFEDSAELDEETRLKILAYAVKHSADKSWYKRSRKIMASLKENVFPLRITETPYIKQKHSEIPSKLITGNPKVNSLSYCDNCHTKAKDGIFDDDTVFIPGHGRW